MGNVVGVDAKRSIADALLENERTIRLAEAARLVLVCALVDAYRTVPELPTPGAPTLRPSGADGTPDVDEFLVNELHPLLRVSPASAWSLIHDAINLRERHPRTWAMVQHGAVPVWQARQVAQLCAPLPADAAQVIDERIAPALATLPWARAKRRLTGYVISADPQRHVERHEAAQRERFVRISHVGDGTSWLVAHLSSVDAITLGHAIDGIARQLVEEPGYAGSLDHARADALGLLGRPTDGARRSSGPGLPRPVTTMVVHVNAADLERVRPGHPGPTEFDGDAGCGKPRHGGPSEFDGDAGWGTPGHRGPSGPGAELARARPDRVPAAALGSCLPGERAPVARVEGPLGLDDLGPVLLAHVRDLLAHHRVRVLPVIDLRSDPTADTYAIPERIRQHVILRDQVSVFPYSTRAARACDLDHTQPWHHDGPPGQTRPSNLGALDRRAHRAKTHAGWAVEQASPGVFTWTSPLGYRYRVDRHGTHQLADAEDGDGSGPSLGLA